MFSDCLCVKNCLTWKSGQVLLNNDTIYTFSFYKLFVIRTPWSLNWFWKHVKWDTICNPRLQDKHSHIRCVWMLNVHVQGTGTRILTLLNLYRWKQCSRQRNILVNNWRLAVNPMYISLILFSTDAWLDPSILMNAVKESFQSTWSQWGSKCQKSSLSSSRPDPKGSESRSGRRFPLLIKSHSTSGWYCRY